MVIIIRGARVVCYAGGVENYLGKRPYLRLLLNIVMVAIVRVVAYSRGAINFCVNRFADEEKSICDLAMAASFGSGVPFSQPVGLIFDSRLR